MQQLVLGLVANVDGVATAGERGGDQVGVLLVGDGGDLTRNWVAPGAGGGGGALAVTGVVSAGG